MPKLSEITSIEINNHGTRLCIRFLTKEARYHVWADAETLEVGVGGAEFFGTMKGQPVIYKNSHATNHTQPGYFQCQYLKLSVPANRKLVDGVIQRVRDEGLVEAAEREIERAARDRALAAFQADIDKGRDAFGRMIDAGEADGSLSASTVASIRELMVEVQPESWAALTRAFRG